MNKLLISAIFLLIPLKAFSASPQEVNSVVDYVNKKSIYLLRLVDFAQAAPAPLTQSNLNSSYYFMSPSNFEIEYELINEDSFTVCATSVQTLNRNQYLKAAKIILQKGFKTVADCNSKINVGLAVKKEGTLSFLKNFNRSQIINPTLKQGSLPFILSTKNLIPHLTLSSPQLNQKSPVHFIEVLNEATNPLSLNSFKLWGNFEMAHNCDNILYLQTCQISLSYLGGFKKTNGYLNLNFSNGSKATLGLSGIIN